MARGTYVEGVSDIDVVGLVKAPNIKWENIETSILQANDLEADHFELMCSSFSESLSKTYPALAMILKTQSLCIFGESVLHNLPAYKPVREMLLHYKWLESDLMEFERNNKVTPIECAAIMKLILRVGFELVMERKQEYTADLYPSFRTFVKYYPAYEREMELCFQLYLNPTGDKNVFNSWFKPFFTWLLAEVKKRLYTIARN